MAGAIWASRGWRRAQPTQWLLVAVRGQSIIDYFGSGKAKMQRRHIAILGLLLWAASMNVCPGFSLLGPLSTPATTWQTPALGYNVFGTEIGGPVNTGEEYRWNLHDITYAFDDSFLDYFGVDGIDAVESALAIISDVGPVSNLRPYLDEFVLNARL